MSQADAFTGEISLFPYTFIPPLWLECNGQVLAAQQYSALFSVIGNKFDPSQPAGKFRLPNLNRQAVMGPGQGPGLTNRVDGTGYGEQAVELTALQTGHRHAVINKGAQSPATDKTSAPQASSTIGAITVLPPGGGAPFGVNSFVPGGQPDAIMAAGSIAPAGMHAPAPHDNCQPVLALRFCICVNGEYPVHS